MSRQAKLTAGPITAQLVRLCLRGEQQHTQRQCDFCGFIAHSFSPESLFCFVLWTSRSHKLPVGGKEEKILIYNQKELNKPMGILYASLAFYEDGNDCRAVPSPLGRGPGRE